MNSIIYFLLSVACTIFSLTAWADSTGLLNQAKAANATRYQFAVSNSAEIRNTGDNKAFTIWWQPSSSAPTGVIVTLHGHGSYATDEFYLWQPYAQTRGYAILALQWWFGGGETVADYYLPQEMYPIVANLLKEKGVNPGTVLFHGYSRGSANSYAMTALDTASGNRYINMTLSNSGGAAQDFPPNQQIVAGAYGLLPFSGVQWVMYCGELDPDPTASGCPAMTAAKDWVTKYGATFKLLIDDPNGGHGGFMTNSANVNTALAQFAPTVIQPKASQTISFGGAPNVVVGGVGTVLATATSGLAVSFSSLTTSTCTVSGSTVTGASAGACTIAANQLGNANYNAATQATQSITIGMALTPISNARVFAYAEANYPDIFAGTPAAGQYQQYDYRYYPISQNYLAVDTAGVIFLLGPYTGNEIASVGPVESFRGAITAWEATQPLAPPTNVSAGNTGTQTVGSRTFSSSTKLGFSWTAPEYTVDHYVITAAEPLQNTLVSTTSTTTSATLTGLKAATSYTVTVKSCADASCSQSGTAEPASATTSNEYWQLQGTGNTTTGLTRIVSDGNARISATRIGSDAGTSTAGKIQLYYGPNGQTSPRQALSTALTGSAASAGTPSSYLSFTSSGATTGLITPSTAATAVKQIATGQGVPLSAALGSKIRLFFEAKGSDDKTRIYYLDSQDGYVGQDFNSGAPKTCSTTADYTAGGGCVPTIAIGVDGDSVSSNSRISNARQFKLGFPILGDWRWDGAAGAFMVFTTDSITGCTAYNMNHAYAVWDGATWVVQYASDGCPKLFKSAQAAFPMHLGGVRYKLYYGDPSVTTGKLTGSMPFLGPKKLIYADGALSGSAGSVDFEDWESQTQARDVVFLWPNGDQLDSTAEGYIDDYHFLAPTASLDLQVMYLAITNGTEIPFGATAILLNP